MKAHKRKLPSKRRLILLGSIICLLLVFINNSLSFSEDLILSLSSGQGLTTHSVILTLNLAYTSSPLASGLNLDIYYNDEALDNPVASAGQILINAGKEMNISEYTHPYFGVLRIMIAGLNSNIISAGVLATVNFEIKVTAPSGLSPLVLTNLQASNPAGYALSIAHNNGAINVVVGDADADGVLDNVDNCPFALNTNQYDNYPPDKNGIGDACECEGNFDCDIDQDGTDAATFKVDFGRSSFKNPCTSIVPCNGDFTCDSDVDGTDAALFKSDFGRSTFKNSCPKCVGGDWCGY